MAAGLCVVIPSDGAYWDERLEHGVNCIKYLPNDAQSLTNAITDILQQPFYIKRIGKAGQLVADRYAARRRYRNIHSKISKELRYVA